MICREFIDRYTEFRDGLIAAPRELRRFQRHVAQCAACRRYDAALRSGVAALQNVETIEPSADFRRRLDARLARERAGAAAVPARAGLLAAVLGLLALSPLRVRGGPPPPPPPTTALPPPAFP